MGQNGSVSIGLNFFLQDGHHFEILENVFKRQFAVTGPYVTFLNNTTKTSPPLDLVFLLLYFLLKVSAYRDV